jgi:hypothetical protein
VVRYHEIDEEGRCGGTHQRTWSAAAMQSKYGGSAVIRSAGVDGRSGDEGWRDSCKSFFSKNRCEGEREATMMLGAF